LEGIVNNNLQRAFQVTRWNAHNPKTLIKFKKDEKPEQKTTRFTLAGFSLAFPSSTPTR